MTREEMRFYPKFPFIEANELDPYYGTNFNDAIVTKKEFALEKLARIEPFPTTPGDYLHHQKYIALYMSTYDELLLFHEPGTGKTCTAVAAIEALRYAEDKTIKRAVICAKGEGLTKNFLQEFIFTCTDGRYVPNNYDELTDIQKTTKTNKIASVFYSFKTFETFAKDLSGMNDTQIKDAFEDTIFVLDEVHNLRDHDESRSEPDPDAAEAEAEDPSIVKVSKLFKSKRIANVYEEFHRLFHLLTRRKIILMSGTPIKDTPDEFASLMNLLLPSNKQINVKTFVRTYFNADQTALVKKRELADIIRGRVSYLNSATTTVMKTFVGTKLGDLNHYIVYPSEMSDFQSKAYATAYAEDRATKAIFIHSRQASLFVYPDGSYGTKGYNKYVVNKRELANLQHAMKDISTVRQHSAKYAQILDILLTNPKSKHFVYCQYVAGSGAIVLGKILESFGFSRAFGKERKKGLRYALCTRYDSTPKQVQKIVNRFNDDDNVDGEYISTIIGSRVLNEGFTLKNVRNEFILTGHWNYSEVAQTIARGWRLGSHNALLDRGDENVRVNVYQCVSVPANGYNVPSIDLDLYETAEKKDVVNRLVERLVKETAFDCALTVDRNKVYGYDGQRECDYGSCEYTCDGTIGSPLDSSTYNLLRDVKEGTKTEITNRLNEVMSAPAPNEYALDKLTADFNGKYTLDLITEAVASIIDSSALFYDSHGFPYFLGLKDKRTLFLTLDPSNNGLGYLNDYYTRNKILEAMPAPTFTNLVDDMYDKALPMLVEQLFEYPKLTKKLLVDLPYLVQRIVLEGCLIADMTGLTENVSVRNDILEFYKGLYGERNGKLTVWIYSNEIGTTCYDERTRRFVGCVIADTEEPTVTLKSSPVGWYGLHNPSTGDFCLRNVEERDVNKKDLTAVDLRKITVGKRCVNYDKSKLVDISADKMNLAPREGLYAKSKKDLCADMKIWFRDNKLLETNFDCGTSQKKRMKFAP